MSNIKKYLCVGAVALVAQLALAWSASASLLNATPVNDEAIIVTDLKTDYSGGGTLEVEGTITDTINLGPERAEALKGAYIYIWVTLNEKTGEFKKRGRIRRWWIAKGDNLLGRGRIVDADFVADPGRSNALIFDFLAEVKDRNVIPDLKSTTGFVRITTYSENLTDFSPESAGQRPDYWSSDPKDDDFREKNTWAGTGGYAVAFDAIRGRSSKVGDCAQEIEDTALALDQCLSELKKCTTEYSSPVTIESSGSISGEVEDELLNACKNLSDSVSATLRQCKQDLDICDPDTDGDKVTDREDKCPDTASGFVDEVDVDGCSVRQLCEAETTRRKCRRVKFEKLGGRRDLDLFRVCIWNRRDRECRARGGAGPIERRF